MSARGLVVAVALVAACGSRPRERAPEAPPDPRLPAMEALVDDLHRLAVGDAPDPAFRLARARALLDGRLRLDTFVDQLLVDPRLGELAASLLLRTGSDNPSFPMALQSRPLRDVSGWRADLGAADELLYFLYKPCALGESILVEPWWALGTRIRLCPNSYRPEVTQDETGRYRCGARYLEPNYAEVCGCGPWLALCARDQAHATAANDSARRELVDTIAWTVDHDEPLARVYTRNDTVRDASAELLERRWRLLDGEAVPIADLAAWKRGPPVARREAFDGHHAGILTTPYFVNAVDSPRTMLRVIYEAMWCQQPASSQVTSEAVLALHAVDLRQGEGWQALASRPVCTTCHARLDYGVQFFSGYIGPIRSRDFWPRLRVAGEGPLYGRDIDDEIGRGPLTPRTFAEIATGHPAFARCMVDKVGDHVFGDQLAADDRLAIAAAMQSQGTLRALMRVALLRYASARMTPAALAPVTAPGSTPGEGGVQVSPRLAALLEDHCNDCHDLRPDRLSGPVLPAARASAMLDQVAFGGMPKDRAMPRTLRDELVRELVTGAFADPAERAEAMAFYLDGLRAQRVHRLSTLTQGLATTAGAAPLARPEGVEHGLISARNQLTPALAVRLGAAALALCKAIHRAPGEIETCVALALDPASLLIGD
jgi:hypothetical protein